MVPPPFSTEKVCGDTHDSLPRRRALPTGFAFLCLSVAAVLSIVPAHSFGYIMRDMGIITGTIMTGRGDA